MARPTTGDKDVQYEISKAPDFMKIELTLDDAIRLTPAVEQALTLDKYLKDNNPGSSDLKKLMLLEFTREGGPRPSVMKRLHGYFNRKRTTQEKEALDPFVLPVKKKKRRRKS